MNKPSTMGAPCIQKIFVSFFIHLGGLERVREYWIATEVGVWNTVSL